MHLIEAKQRQLEELCKKYKVKQLYVFGSILTGRFNEKSDIDFSVDFDKETINSEMIDWANLFFGFQEELEILFKRNIDLVFDDHVKNPYFREELDRTKILVYG